MWEQTCVGAGLPAMQSPRCISDTEVMLSQASQLPHKPAPTFDRCRCSEQLTEQSTNLPVAYAAALARTGHRSSPAPASAQGTSHG
ncbi:hypothetical protein FFI16_025015 [Pseudomonas sp. KBS0710]|nr:hypothetical protein FFI16_025015 [Pseudomonas sp. KBS0710]